MKAITPVSRPDEAGLRAIVEELAAIERAPASPGEREAAHIIAGRMRALGLRAEVEDEAAFGSYAWPAGIASAAAAGAGLAARRGPLGRLIGFAGGALAA